jgi:hypothetical protein
MVRNRKRRPSTEVADVIVSRYGVLSCWRCGQHFQHVFEGLSEYLATLRVETQAGYDERVEGQFEVAKMLAWGWRFDGTTWRPTADSRRRWMRACRVVQDPERYSAAEVEEARQGLARGAFPRNDPGREPGTNTRPPTGLVRGFTLPTRIECIQCGALNHVGDD